MREIRYDLKEISLCEGLWTSSAQCSRGPQRAVVYFIFRLCHGSSPDGYALDVDRGIKSSGASELQQGTVQNMPDPRVRHQWLISKSLAPLTCSLHTCVHISSALSFMILVKCEENQCSRWKEPKLFITKR